MVTKGQRRLGRTIRKLETSVEFSQKESRAKVEERIYISKVKKSQDKTDCVENSAVQDLRELADRRKNK